MAPIATLAKLSDSFYVNPAYIVKVEIVSEADQARANGIKFREQWTIDQAKAFTVSIHIRSSDTNPDRFYKYFSTRVEAQAYVDSLFIVV